METSAEASPPKPDLTSVERQLVEAFRRLDPVQQRIAVYAVRHLASRVPGVQVTLSVEL